MNYQLVTGSFPTGYNLEVQPGTTTVQRWLDLVSGASLPARDVRAARAIAASFTRKTVAAEIPLNEIASRMGASRTTARRAAHSLRHLGFLSFRQDPEEYGANIFRLTLPRRGARR